MMIGVGCLECGMAFPRSLRRAMRSSRLDSRCSARSRRTTPVLSTRLEGHEARQAAKVHHGGREDKEQPDAIQAAFDVDAQER